MESAHNPLKGFLSGLSSEAAHESDRPTRGSASRLSYHDEPLVAADDVQLRAAFADNLHALFRAIAGLDGAELEEVSGVHRHHAWPFNPMFKGVWSARLGAADTDNVISETIAWFQNRGAPFFFWWIDERDQPTDLAARLVARGFAAWEVNAPGMAAELNSLSFDLVQRVPTGYSTVRVENERMLQDFTSAFVAGLEVPEWAGQAWADATLALGIAEAPWQPYVGYLDGQPVASNMLFCGAGVASVFGVATVPGARGQGIGAAITLAAFDDARARGYRYGVLFSSEMGLSVYQRIGMREVGAGISRYLWRAA